MEVTPAYTKEQDGVAERYNRTLAEWGKTNLDQSGLPLIFWAEAQKYAEFTLQRSWNSTIQGIPNVEWNRCRIDPLKSNQGDISMLRPFGCAVAFHVAKETRKKGDLRGEEGIMLGYEWDAGTYGYRVWDLKRRRIFITRDVAFDESTFPLKTSTRTPQQSDNRHPVRYQGGMEGWDDEESEGGDVTRPGHQQWPDIDHPSDVTPPTEQQPGVREQEEVTGVEEQPTGEDGGIQGEGHESQHSESESGGEEDEALQRQLI